MAVEESEVVDIIDTAAEEDSLGVELTVIVAFMSC